MANDEPSYMFYARANVRDSLPSTPLVVASLLNRIDTLEREKELLDRDSD